MAQINIRIEDELKSRAEALFDELGMNMTTAFQIFIRQALREGGIPFEITTKTDPFYSESNLHVLKESIAQIEEGKVVRKTMDELLAMEE